MSDFAIGNNNHTSKWRSFVLGNTKASQNATPSKASPDAATVSRKGWGQSFDPIQEASNLDTPARWVAAANASTTPSTKASPVSTESPITANLQAADAPASGTPTSAASKWNLGYTGSMVPPNQLYGGRDGEELHTIDTTKYGPYAYGADEQAEAKANESQTSDENKVQSVSAAALASGLEKISLNRNLDTKTACTRKEIRLELQADKAAAEGQKQFTEEERQALRMAAQVAGGRLEVDWANGRHGQSSTFIDSHGAKSAAKLDGDASTVTREELQAQLYKRAVPLAEVKQEIRRNSGDDSAPQGESITATKRAKRVGRSKKAAEA